MNKIVMLIPALMLENNRKANHAAMAYAKDYYPVDEFIVNDAEFLPDDYREGFTYIGHHAERQGFVKTRNQLLEYFYNSDADYAIWMDANGKVSKSTLNDFVSIVNAIKEGKVPVDVIYSTLGINISGERIAVKKLPDYNDSVYLVKFKSGYEWMHGLIMKNFKKYYGEEVYIDERCDPRKGTSEDIYFAKMLRERFDYRLAPTVVVTKPSNKTSTWVADKSGYKYPKPDYATVDGYIKENLTRQPPLAHVKTSNTIIISREETYKCWLKPYKPKPKKIRGYLIGWQV